MIPFTRGRLGSIWRSASAARVRLLAMMVVAVALTIPSPAYPQVLYGTLTGHVTDETGASMVAVKVQALNVGTNVAKSATTDNRGVYLLNDLQPGVYDVTIDAPGFQVIVHKAVAVDSNAVRRIDAQLKVSGVAETIEVTATSTPLQTERGDIHLTQMRTASIRLRCGSSSTCPRQPRLAT